VAKLTYLYTNCPIAPRRSPRTVRAERPPGTPGRGDNFFHGQRLDAATKRIAIDRVTIPNQVPPRITFRKRLGHLLSRPLCRRMFSDAKVKNSSALMLDDEEDKQYPQANRRHGEEIDGNDLPYVVLQECPPGLRGRSLDGLQDSRHGSFGHRDSELE